MDAMCSELDSKTGKAKHTFLKGYKKEHRVKLTVRVRLRRGNGHDIPHTSSNDLNYYIDSFGHF